MRRALQGHKLPEPVVKPTTDAIEVRLHSMTTERLFDQDCDTLCGLLVVLIHLI